MNACRLGFLLLLFTGLVMGGCDAIVPPAEPDDFRISIIDPAEVTGGSMYLPGETVELSFEFNTTADKTSVTRMWVENENRDILFEGESGTFTRTLKEGDRTLYGVVELASGEILREKVGGVLVARESQGQHLYLIRGKEGSKHVVYEVDTMCEHVHKLPELLPVVGDNGSPVPPRELSVAPDGVWVLVADGSPGRSDVQTPSLLNRHTGERQDLFVQNESFPYAQDPQISPDGSMVLFTANEHLGSDAVPQIWASDLTGGDARLVTRSTPCDTSGGLCFGNAVQGDWAPDGSIYAVITALVPREASYDILARFELQGTDVIMEEVTRTDSQEQGWFLEDLVWPWVYLSGGNITRHSDGTSSITSFKARYNLTTGDYQEWEEFAQLTGHPRDGWYVGFAKGGSKWFVSDESGTTISSCTPPVFPEEIELIPPLN